MSEVTEVELVSKFEATLRQGMKQRVRSALFEGDPVERMLAEVTLSVSEKRSNWLEMLRCERDAVREQALQTHRVSRMRKEQVEHIREREDTSAEIKEDRRVQAASDDRYASRREWQHQEARRTKHEAVLT